MRVFFITVCLVLSASSKPYNKPSIRYLPSAGTASHHPQITPNAVQSNSHGLLGLNRFASGGSLSLGSSYSVFSPAKTMNRNLGSVPASTSINYRDPTTAAATTFNKPQLSSHSAPTTGHAKHQSTVPPLQTSGALIQKHIYVHVPPPELEESHKLLTHPLPSVQNKQYKIIFIKAPSPSPTYNVEALQQQIAAAQQSDEKTMVYVLVNKSNEPNLQEIALPHVPRVQPPSIPEVFYVNYKAERDLLRASHAEDITSYVSSPETAAYSPTVISSNPAISTPAIVSDSALKIVSPNFQIRDSTAFNPSPEYFLEPQRLPASAYRTPKY